jgi:hypothetical protein
VWGRYGFVDAFNPQSGWTASGVIAIDTGIMLVMAENLQTGFVWRQFMGASGVQRGMQRAGFSSKDDHPAAAVAGTPIRETSTGG